MDAVVWSMCDALALASSILSLIPFDIPKHDAVVLVLGGACGVITHLMRQDNAPNITN